MAAHPRVCQNLFNPSVISHLELLCSVFELVEYLLLLPKVVKGRSKGQMDSSLFVEITSKIPVCGIFFLLFLWPSLKRRYQHEQRKR